MSKYLGFLGLILISALISGCNQATPSTDEYVENAQEQHLINIEEMKKDIVEERINELEGIEQIYDLSFEEVQIPQKTFEEFETIDVDKLKEVMIEEVIDSYTFKIYMKKEQPEGSEHLFYVGFTTEENKSAIYEIGEIGYGPHIESLNPYPLVKTTLFHEELLKIGGICGANCHITYYLNFQPDKEPAIFLCIHANGLELDLNGDGINELIATSGTIIDTTIYLEDQGKVIKTDLFTLPGTIQVIHIEGNEFQIFFENKKLARYQYKDQQLHFIEFIE